MQLLDDNYKSFLPVPPQTPCSNTGLKSPNIDSLPSSFLVGLHWLQGCGTFLVGSEFPLGGCLSHYSLSQRFRYLIDSICSSYSESPVFERGKGCYLGKYWENSGGSPGGLKFCWTETDTQLDYFVSLPGSLLERLPSFENWGTLSFLAKSCGFRPTRIDIALDDYSRSVDLDTIVSSIESNQVARFRTFSEVRSGRLGSDSVGRTIYFGSPQSDKRLRIYDKFVESNGRQDCIRWELELSSKQALIFSQAYLELDYDGFLELAPQFLAGVVLGSIDFVQRTSRQLERCPRVEWWDKFVNAIASQVRFSLPRVTTSIHKKVEWAFSQLAPTFAIFKQVFRSGFDSFVQSLVNNGSDRFTETHHAIISSAQKYLSSC